MDYLENELKKEDIAKIKKEIVDKYSKYCNKCKGSCCAKKEKEVTFFSWEINKFDEKSKNLLRKRTLRKDWSRNLIVRRVSTRGKCIFLGKRGCDLDIKNRSLDCLSFPIYPVIKYTRGERKMIKHMIVHKNCDLAYQIAKDFKLIRLLEKFWNVELQSIRKKDIGLWFGNKKNYWLDKNVIKIEETQ